MNIDDKGMRYETEALSNIKRTEALYDEIIGSRHPDNVAEIAAQGHLVSPSQEVKLQGLMDGSRTKGNTLAQELRYVLGLADGAAEVGVRKHSDMTATSASKYALMVDALKSLVAETEEASILTDFDMDDEEELDMDEELGATVRTSEMQSEIDFLREQVKKMQEEAGRRQDAAGSRFSSRGGTQTNRYGIGS